MFEPLLDKLNNMRLVLATSSKQRQEILNRTKLKFEIVPSSFDENLDRTKHTFSQYVIGTAHGKVENVWEKLKHDSKPPDVIIGIDTMVTCDGELFGKPVDERDAYKMIRKLTSGLPHIVYTGVCIKYKNVYDKSIELATVYMEQLTEEEIRGYIQTGEFLGKAGAYAIQGIGSSFVRRIDGDYNTVIGLPLCSITKRLKYLIQHVQN